MFHNIPLPFTVLYEYAERKNAFELNFIKTFAQSGNYSIKFVTDNPQILHFTMVFRENVEHFHWSSAFYEEKYILLLSPPQFYNSYEKMLLPLDDVTWICVLITFSVALSVIFVSNLMFRNFYRLLVGENVKTPSLRLLAIFFGISQKETPRENFSRIILIFFTYFCLVLRTGYQGRTILLLALVA